ncbi:MAG: GNAT family N-acetyltransferase [Candidatus Bathyarchaeota archaeon]|nr:MAG: GNAT family N-acetyltransferase [Candidatus Bathyarchaeota archaeon]
MSVDVARAVPESDTAPIANLIEICRGERRTVLNSFTPEEERAYLEAMGPREAVFVAKVDGEFAGFAGIAPRWGYSERLRHCAECGTWVMPGMRGRGVGSALWRAGVLPFCREAGFRHIGAFVMAHNTGAIAFYESLGFSICGRHRRLVDWDGEFLDAVEIEMWLEDRLTAAT